MSLAARPYAVAFLDIAPNGYDVPAFLAAARGLGEAFSGDARLRAFFGSPAIKETDKAAALMELAKRAGIDEHGTRLLRLALQRRRLLDLDEILAAIQEESDHRGGVVEASVTIPAQLSEEQRRAIEEVISAASRPPRKARGRPVRSSRVSWRGWAARSTTPRPRRRSTSSVGRHGNRKNKERERPWTSRPTRSRDPEAADRRIRKSDRRRGGRHGPLGRRRHRARLRPRQASMAGELLEFGHDVFGIVLNLEEDNVGAVLLGESDTSSRRATRSAAPAHRPGAGRPGADRPRRQRARRARSTARARSRRPRHYPVERIAPGVVDAPAGERAPPDRHQGDRRDDPDRPRPARADHRRPPDRQDRDRGRHDHQPEGEGRRLHLRRDRSEAVDGRAGRRTTLEEHGAMEYTIVVAADGLGPGAAAVHRAVRRLRDGRVLPRQRQARAHHLRRPVQARGRLPPDLAAAAPPAGPRGVSRATSSTSTRACSSAPPSSPTSRRRVADGAADHRDPGRRRLGLHSRPTSSRSPTARSSSRPTCSTRASGPRHQRRHLGLARRRQRADQGHEAGRRHAPPRARRSTARWPPSRSSAPTSTRPRRRSSPAASAWSSSLKQGPVPARARRAAGRVDLRRHERLSSIPLRGRRRAAFEAGMHAYLKSNAEGGLSGHRATGQAREGDREALAAAITGPATLPQETPRAEA